MILKETVISTNKKFSTGKMVNEGSLDFALAQANKTKDMITQLATIVRGIVLDHVFEDGNKRTAAAIVMALALLHQKAYDPYRIDAMIIKIATGKVKAIEKIRRLLNHAIVR